jgi:hypothetical protein
MMGSKIIKRQKKCFFLKNYHHLWQLEKAIQAIQEYDATQLQLSVLGKLGDDCIANDKQLKTAKKDLKEYWKGSLGSTSDFGLFCNPEIGTLFIAGYLASQFLHEISGKTLGEMTSGPYGILRGIGIAEKDSFTFLKALNEHAFLLILRGYDDELDRAEALLESLEE